MRHVASNAATDAFYDLMNELFDKIEADAGKTKSREIQAIVTSRRDSVVSSIQQGVNSKIQKEAIDYFASRWRKKSPNK